MKAGIAPVVATLAIVAGALLVPLGGASAPADPIGNCTTTSGTIIAVDFAHWNGPLVRGCGVNQPNGYALLHAAGFSSAGDQHDGPTFICRLGNEAFNNGTQYPTPDDDACHNTPPASAYWSYWVAPSGQDSWTYSPRGAFSDTPHPGEVELWTFGGTDVGGTTGGPNFDPNALRAHNPAPVGDTVSPTTRAPTPTDPAAQTGPAPKSGAVPPTSVGAPVPGSGATVPSTTAATTTGGPRPTLAARATTTSNGAPATPASTIANATGPTGEPPLRIIDALPAVHAHASSGSAVPLLIAIGLVIVLSGAAGGTLLRRRQQER